MTEKKLKVALVITRMDRGGAPDIVMGLFEYLKARGNYDLTLITGPTVFPSKEMEVFMKSRKDHIRVISELKRDPHPVSDVTALIKLFSLFKEERFDIVISYSK